jgi:hypothetical protein
MALRARVAMTASAIIFLCFLGTSAAAAEVSLPAGDSRTLAADSKEVTFPIDIVGEVPADLPVSVSEILRAGVSQPVDSLTPQIDEQASTLTLAIDDQEAFARQGDYQVTLRIVTPANATAGTPATTQTLLVTIARQAASIAAGETVKVKQFVGPLADWALSAAIYPGAEPKLTLAVGDGGELLSISAAQTERTAGTVTVKPGCTDGDAPACPASSTELNPPIGSDEALALTYDLAGFPLGKEVRHIEVRSPQLTAPVSVAFEVTTALSPVLIPLIVLLGLLVGFLVRVALPGVTARSRKEQTRLELLRIIDTIRQLYGGPGGDRELVAALDPIAHALDKKTASQKDVDTRQAALVAAFTAATARLAEAEKNAVTSGGKIEGEWMLPPDIEVILIAARAAVNDALENAGKRRLEATRSSDSRATNALSDLLVASREWLRRFREAVRALETAVGTSAEPAEVASLKTLLAKTETAPAEPISDPRLALTAVSERMRLWTHALRPRLDDARHALAARSLDAARVLGEALAEKDPADAMTNAIDPLTTLINAPSPAAPVRVEVTSLDTAGEPAPIDVSILQTLPVDHLDAIPGHAAFRLASRASEWTRYAILAVIASAVALLVGQDSWEGTGAQILIVFGWAFALDLTTDKVTAMFPARAELPTFTPATTP